MASVLNTNPPNIPSVIGAAFLAGLPCAASTLSSAPRAILPTDANGFVPVDINSVGIVTPVYTTQLTIAAGQSLSSQANLGGFSLIGVIVPAGWTAAGLSFTGSPSAGGTDYALWDGTAGAELTVSNIPTTAVWLRLDPTMFLGLNFVKLLSGTHGSPVNQVSSMTLTLVLRQL